MDALYFRVSADRQTTENQFEDLLQVAEKDGSGREWYAEMENDERSQTIKAGHARARAAGKQIGRPRRIFDRAEVVELGRAGLSWAAISEKPHVGEGTARRAYSEVLRGLSEAPQPCQNSIAKSP